MNMLTHTLPLFKLEDYLAQYEFTAKHLLCCSDAETMTLKELLNLADPDLRETFETMSLGYTEVKGNPSLRTDVAKLYRGLNHDNILCFAGAEEGIFITFSTLLEKGDHVVVFTPCYQSLESIPRSLGCDVQSISLREDNQWKIDFDELESVLRPNTKLVIINTPHNPTGQMLDQSELETLIAMLRSRGIYLFADEVYFHLGPTTTKWPDQTVELYERGISLNVMSKAYGLAGLRVGWIASHDHDLLKKCEQMKHYTTICNAGPSEILSHIAIRARDKLIQRNNTIIDENLEHFDTFLMRYRDHFSWVKPKGGCTGFVRYHGNQSTEVFAHHLVKDQGVLLLPSVHYSFGDQHFRIGFGRKNFKEGLDVFEKGVHILL